MKELCDLKVHIDGQHTFFVNQTIISKFSGRLRRMIKEEKKKTQIIDSGIEINGFPGGPSGFELVSRFCYSKGRIPIHPSTISVLHCAAIFLEMTEELSRCNLLHQTETLLEGIFYWDWNDILTALKDCEPFFSCAETSGLLHKLISSLLAKITANADSGLSNSSSSSSSSPETGSGFRSSSSAKTPESIKPCSRRAWWFDDLTNLSPMIIERVIKTMGAYGTDNSSLLLTKFLIHYLKTALQKPGVNESKSEYSGLADTAVNGVVLMGKAAFSCRGMLWVLRVVSRVGPSKECRHQLERLIGGVLDQATLDDLLISGHDGGVYDVNLVLRLLRYFVSEEDGMSLQKMKTVGRLIDKYMREISPDQTTKVSKFLAVAESLPDAARDCYDGIYKAIDIYLESHPTLSQEERTRLCRCLNYEKLTLEACKDLAKSPRIPPRIAMQALMAQKSKLHSNGIITCDPNMPNNTYEEIESETSSDTSEEKEKMKMNLQRMQCRVIELEKVCKEMKGQMSKIVKSRVINSPGYNRALPKLC
ncbi:hypothetical protein AAC387_Pa04g2234 [Persea americana]